MNRQVFKKLKEKVDSGTPESKDLLKASEDVIEDFFGKICNAINDHFLERCHTVISCLDRVKEKETIYLDVVKLLVLRYVVISKENYLSNKVKCVIHL